MQSEVVLIGLVGLTAVVVGVAYWFNPFFVKNLIGENDPFERKIFKGNFPFWQFLLISLIFPTAVLLYLSIWWVIRERELVNHIWLSEKYLLVISWICFMLIAYGGGTHGASVSISHYMEKLRYTKAFRVVEFYHQLISHFLVIVPVIVATSAVAFFEINHPLPSPMWYGEALVAVISGTFLGVVFAFLIIEGRGKYYGIPGLIIATAVLVITVTDAGLTLWKLPLVLTFIVTYITSLGTMLFWRIKNGSMRETMGDFFHKSDTTNYSEGSSPTHEPSIDTRISK